LVWMGWLILCLCVWCLTIELEYIQLYSFKIAVVGRLFDGQISANRA